VRLFSLSLFRLRFPMPTLRSRLLFSGLLLWTLTARADVTLAPLFRDGAVLQQGKPVPVWGHATAGERITVAFGDQTIGATAGADGRWTVVLAALPASMVGADLVARGHNTVIVHDVVVGEVWLCSGQSNMEWPVERAQDAAQEIAGAQNPLIRQIRIEQAVAGTPRETVGGEWQAASPATVGKFTAVGYFFAREIFQKLGVPIGIVHSSWGGTPIESWLSPAALASNPAFAIVGERWRKNLAEYPASKAAYDAALADWTKAETAAQAQGAVAQAAFLKRQPQPRAPRGPGDSWTPTGPFNGMISPLLPYALRGALWYQGESNSERPGEYEALFAALITSWRAHFGQGDFPFFWVSLANYKMPSDPTGMAFALIREAQTQALALPNTGQALAIDIGNPDNIHPTNKQEVGRRLALIARAKTYHIPCDWSGPVFASATPERGAMRVRFAHNEGGLLAHDRPVQSLEVAGADRKFHPAQGRIEGATLVVSAPEAPAPVAVRYAWKNAPEANLFNGAGLPAAPFRSDNW
jgi:sialate O-acetylesterase